MAIFAKKPSLESLAAEQLLWDGKLEALAGPLAEARLAAQEQRERALLGQENAKTLAAAEGVLAGLVQNYDTCLKKLADLKDQQTLSGTQVYEALGKAAPAETLRLSAEQLAAGNRMARAMATAVYLNESYFRPGDQVAQIGFHPCVYGVQVHLEKFMETFQRTFQEELNRLRASEPEPATFFGRVMENRNLRTNFEFGRELAVQTIVRAAVAKARGEE